MDPAIAGNSTTLNTAAVNAIHANGGRAICYVSAGTFEPWRPDAASYPDSIKGRAVSGFKDERWLDIRQTSVLFRSSMPGPRSAPKRASTASSGTTSTGSPTAPGSR